MKLTIRELNAFGNVLYHEKKFELAKEIYALVGTLLEFGLTDYEFEDTTPDGKKLCALVKKAEGYLHYLKTTKRERK